MAYFIDWEKIPEGYDWVAIDGDGRCFAYAKKPILFINKKQWVSNGYSYKIKSTTSDTPNWQQLLFHRHESQAGY